MIYKTPLRLTTLHLEQRFLIDDVTFITISPCIQPYPCIMGYPAKGSIIPAILPLVQHNFKVP